MNYYQESHIFIFFFIIGIIISMLFDIFRAIRKVFKSNNIATFIQDLLFLIISGFLIIYAIIKLNNGYIRFYIFISILSGIILYFLTLSDYYVIILTLIIKIIKKILILPIKLFIIANNKYKMYKKKDFK